IHRQNRLGEKNKITESEREKVDLKDIERVDIRNRDIERESI
ncbi:unnamed protein product, partial [Brassica oleracea]